MKRLTRCDHALEAAHWVNVLRAAGIRAVTRNTSLGGALGEIPWLECAPEVWLLDDLDEGRARELIDALRRPAAAGDAWVCATCGEAAEAQFAECWRCGRPRG